MEALWGQGACLSYSRIHPVAQDNAWHKIALGKHLLNEGMYAFIFTDDELKSQKGQVI